VAGKFEFEWWRQLVAGATDEQLEQAASGLGREMERSSPTQLAVAVQIMHDEVLGQLGQRSRATMSVQYCEALRDDTMCNRPLDSAGKCDREAQHMVVPL